MPLIAFQELLRASDENANGSVNLVRIDALKTWWTPVTVCIKGGVICSMPELYIIPLGKIIGQTNNAMV